MTADRTPAIDPILAMVPEVRGRRILEPCVLYARLGRGGMGAVYLAKHLTLQQKQVVKCLWLMGSGGPGQGQFVERFQQEARIAAAMTHQNLVRVTHVDRLGELHYLVMEYVEGEDVDRRIQRTGPMSEEAALTVLLGAAQGLGYAHARGIVHRDVKPANLMISTHGEVKVIDLGLARAMDTTRQQGATIGTLGSPPYMPPEQWENPAVGPSGDVWALGAVLHFLLTGRSPVAPRPSRLEEIRAAASDPRLADRISSELRISRAARRVLRRCLQTDPNQRYADARELAAELAELVVGNELLLADAAGVSPAHGDEPDDDELRALERALATGDAGLDLTKVDDRTIAHGPIAPIPVDPRVAPGDTAPMPDIVATPTPRLTPRITPLGLPPARRRRRSGLAGLAAVAAVTVAGAAGVAIWPRTDYEALQREAMAAIYQERFADAEQALLQLERVPAFADQARRLHIDALVKSAERLAAQEPVTALQRLATARTVAGHLLIARDTDDALARIAAADEAPRANLGAKLAESVAVQRPVAETVVTRASQEVIVRFTPGTLGLRVAIQGRPLQEVEDGVWGGAWAAPEQDGPAQVQVVVEEPLTQVRHVVGVPVVVKRGAVALHLDGPTGPVRAAAPELEARVENGPLAVRCTVIAPDGAQHDGELGEHDGAFVVPLTLGDASDGTYRVRLHAQSGEQAITSPECLVVVDRTAPGLRVDAVPRWTSGTTLLLRGSASESSRVFLAGQEALAVSTDAALGFALPVTLPATDGPVAIRIGARDAAGNEDPAACVLDLVVDRAAPAFVAGSLRHEPSTAAAELVVVGTLSESGFVGAGDAEMAATGLDGGFEIHAALPAGEIEQPATVRLLARDLAGNIAAPRALAVFVDRRGPRILPGAPDGSWRANGQWCLRVEDHSQPCRIEVDGVLQTPDGAGVVRIAPAAGGAEIVVIARDALGNESRRTLTAAGDDVAAAPPPGPSWGSPVDGCAVDLELRLHERVAIEIAGERIVLRLVRPLRDTELPPGRERDARAVAMLQELEPFYLAETELPVSVWRRDQAAVGAISEPRKNYRFDPQSCQWTQTEEGTWQQPLHPRLLSAVPAEERERLPVVQVTAAEARAFCARHGLRLPTVQEWLAVVRMGSRDRYGWLPAGPLEQRANIADLRLAGLAPALAAFDAVEDGFAALAPVDAFPRVGQEHPWGFRNLLGNAAEWCVTSGARVAACGGSWLSEPRELRVGDSVPDPAITSGAWDCVGFRVARDL